MTEERLISIVCFHSKQGFGDAAYNHKAYGATKKPHDTQACNWEGWNSEHQKDSGRVVLETRTQVDLIVLFWLYMPKDFDFFLYSFLHCSFKLIYVLISLSHSCFLELWNIIRDSTRMVCVGWRKTDMRRSSNSNRVWLCFQGVNSEGVFWIPWC